MKMTDEEFNNLVMAIIWVVASVFLIYYISSMHSMSIPETVNRLRVSRFEMISSLQVINSNKGDVRELEKALQDEIRSNDNFKPLDSARFDWHFEPGESEGIIIAKYGYWWESPSPWLPWFPGYYIFQQKEEPKTYLDKLKQTPMVGIFFGIFDLFRWMPKLLSSGWPFVEVGVYIPFRVDIVTRSYERMDQ